MLVKSDHCQSICRLILNIGCKCCIWQLCNGSYRLFWCVHHLIKFSNVAEWRIQCGSSPFSSQQLQNKTHLLKTMCAIRPFVFFVNYSFFFNDLADVVTWLLSFCRHCVWGCGARGQSPFLIVLHFCHLFGILCLILVPL